MAPEVIQEIGHGVLADIWSLGINFSNKNLLFFPHHSLILIGITTIEIAEGKPPYSDIHPMRVSY